MHVMGAYREVEVINSYAPDRAEWSASSSDCLFSGQIAAVSP
jgi:hypothetical protein